MAKPPAESWSQLDVRSRFEAKDFNLADLARKLAEADPLRALGMFARVFSL